MRRIASLVVIIALAGILEASDPNPGKHKGHPSPTATATPTPAPSPTSTPTPSPTPTPTPSPTPSTVTLAWDAPSDPSVVGYHLWIGFASGQETLSTDVGNVLTWTVQLSPATTYYFYVTAYNQAGDSQPSNEVSYQSP